MTMMFCCGFQEKNTIKVKKKKKIKYLKKDDQSKVFIP